MEVNLFTVLSKPGLVAASHPEHIHAVDLQSIYDSAGPSHFIQALPSCRGVRGSDATPRGCSPSRSTLVFNREVPSWGRVLREAPAQKQLVISKRLLSVNDWSQRGCGGDEATERCWFCLFAFFIYMAHVTERKGLPRMNSKAWMSLTSLVASTWKCLKEGSAEREKHWMFSIAFTNLQRERHTEHFIQRVKRRDVKSNHIIPPKR